MTRYTPNFLRNENGTMNIDFYRGKTRKAANETRARVFREVLVNSIGLMLRSAKRVSKHEAAPSFETPR